MPDNLWIKIVIYGLIGVLAGAIARKKKLRPNKSTEVAGAMRLPQSTAIVGWVFAVLGLIFLVALLAAPAAATVPLIICAVVMGGLGVLLLAYYKNWYILVLQDEVVQRKLSGKIVRIRYDSVKRFKLVPNGPSPALQIHGLNGGRIDVNSRIVDTETIIQKIEYFQRGGQNLHGMSHPQGQSQLPAPQGQSPYGNSSYGQTPYGQLPLPTSAPFGQDPHNPNNQDPRR